MRNAIHVGDDIAQHGGHPRSRGDEPGEVERIHRGKLNDPTAWGDAANGAGDVHRLGERELLSGKTGEKSTTADFASSLHPAIDVEKLPPGRGEGFAHHQISPDDSVALQEGPGKVLMDFGDAPRLRGGEQPPAPGPAALARFLSLAHFRRLEDSEIFHRIGGYQTARERLPHALPPLRR